MRTLILLIAFVAISSIAKCQDNITVQSEIRGYMPNDTIGIDEFLKIGELSIDKAGYDIVSYGLDFMDSGFLQEYKSNSNKLTEEMRSAITNLKKKNMKVTKIFFEDIKIKSPKGIIISGGGLLYVLKIK